MRTREGRSAFALSIAHFVYCCIAVALHAQLSQARAAKPLPASISGGAMFAVVAARPPLRAVVGKAQVVVEATPTLLRCAAGVDVRVTSTWQERDVITAVDAQSVSINSRQRTALTIDTSKCATVRGKVEGDSIDIKGATIAVDSVRGETVRLISSSGGVASTKLVEGLEVDISGTAITLAKLQASQASIRGEDVSIVAAYCQPMIIVPSSNFLRR